MRATDQRDDAREMQIDHALVGAYLTALLFAGVVFNIAAALWAGLS